VGDKSESRGVRILQVYMDGGGIFNPFIIQYFVSESRFVF
jgi:hypothetical protein